MDKTDTSSKYDLGMIGLGVMGRNLLLNMADKGFRVAGYDRDPEKVMSLKEDAEGMTVAATKDRQEFMALLKTPRIIILLVPAGEVVDQVIHGLLPLLSEGDMIIDGGNSFFRDTERRIEFLAGKGIIFMGVGISGGEEGARNGPSIMPGGTDEAWIRIRPVFEAIAARADGEPCVTYIGKGSAGHFVKMVHNGIEYAIMQQISEAYDLLKRTLGLNNSEIHSLFNEWNTGELNSFLIEITGQIFEKKNDDGKTWLLDDILDAAGQKGTGMWTTRSAMELQVPVPSIDIAVAMRDLSKYRTDRQAVSELIKVMPLTPGNGREQAIEDIRGALYCSILLSYAQGFLLMEKGSGHYKYDINLSSVAKIWRGGCIIRARILDRISKILNAGESGNLLLDIDFSAEISSHQEALRNTVCLATRSGIPAPAMMAALGYLDAFRSRNLPTNLIQALRDFFGSHTYQRTDREGVFHTQWVD